MVKSVTEQYDELCEINDIKERIKVACEKFAKTEISAKTIRLLWDKLNNKMKSKLLDGIYAKDVRKESMRRIPPDILMPDAVYVKNKEDTKLWGELLKYSLINNYDNSKTQDKYLKLKKVVDNFISTNPIHIAANYYTELDMRQEVYSIALRGFIDDLIISEKEYDVSPLNLPSEMTIGVEIEFVGANKIKFRELARSLKRFGVDYLNGFNVKHDGSVKKNNQLGAEAVSPILEDSEEYWTKLRDACLFIKCIGGASNKTCGGHVHIGANVLGFDKKAWECFSKVWAEAEPLMYMISNRRGEKTRKDAVRYADLTSSTINQVDWKSVKIKDESDLAFLAHKISSNNRYKGLNLTNIGLRSKNTIEFRLSNGSVDYDIWRENILLYGRLIQIAKIRSIYPTLKQKEYDSFFEHNLPEKEKLIRLLDLVFDKDEEKQIYMNRWMYRAGEKPVFGPKSIYTYNQQIDKEIKKLPKEAGKGSKNIDGASKSPKKPKNIDIEIE